MGGKNAWRGRERKRERGVEGVGEGERASPKEMGKTNMPSRRGEAVQMHRI